MAKLCMLAREDKRVKKAKNAEKKRDALRAKVKSVYASSEEKLAAMIALNKCSRDESACRQRTRCQVCGRPRAVYRKFGLCRIHLREAVMRGDVPGLVKASW